MSLPAPTTKFEFQLIVDQQFHQGIIYNQITKAVRHPDIPLGKSNIGTIFNFFSKQNENIALVELKNVQTIQVGDQIIVDGTALIPGELTEGSYSLEFEQPLLQQLGFDDYQQLSDHCFDIDKKQKSVFNGKLITWELI